MIRGVRREPRPRRAGDEGTDDAGARGPGRDEALRRGRRARRRRRSRSPRARCSRCSATTAPGKSTLIKCLSGALQLDRGVIEMDGRPVAIHSPADAHALGIETVYQDLALFDNLRPSDNFYAGREQATPRWLPRSLRVLKRREMADTTRSDARPAPGHARRPRRGRPPLGRAAAGRRGQPRRRVRLAGRDPRRADGGAGRARVAARPRPDPPAARRAEGGDRRLARDGPRDGGRRPRGRHAARPEVGEARPERRDLRRRSCRSSWGVVPSE